MKGLLVVAGLAAALAVVSGLLLLTVPQGPGQSDSAPAGTAPSAAPHSAPANDPAPPAPPDVEKRLRALEIRLEEVQGQILLAAPGSSWDQDPLEDPDPLLGPAPRGKSPPNGSAQPQKTRKDPDLPEDPAARAEALAQRANDAKRKLNDLRKDLEITRRLEQMSVSMHLQYEERAAMEEIVRNHVRNVDDVASRARELLKDSPFGIAPTDRAALEQMEQDRRRVDEQTEQAILALVGPDRWKEFRKSVKDQNDKERALRRLGQPW